jgi:hypothetical protein
MVANILEECTVFTFRVALLSWGKKGRDRRIEEGS